MRAIAQKMLPILIPAFAPGLRDEEGDEGGEDEGEEVGPRFAGVDDDGGAVVMIGAAKGELVRDEEMVDDRDDEEAALELDADVSVLEAAAALPESTTEGNHVIGSTASFDVRPKGGVLAESPPSIESSSCIWQMPWLSYWL